jgi:hypothetical protein
LKVLSVSFLPELAIGDIRIDEVAPDITFNKLKTIQLSELDEPINWECIGKVRQERASLMDSGQWWNRLSSKMERS